MSEARRLYRLRRARDQVFGTTLFGEPAWDLLLELYVAASEGRALSAIAASIAALTSTDEAIRWLTLLEDLGLVERLYAGNDMSRSLITLSETGLSQMTDLLQHAA